MRNILLIGLLISTASYAQWPLSDIGTTLEIMGVHIKDNGDILISGGLGTVMKSSDCGATWTGISTGYAADLGKMQFVTEDIGYMLADDGQYAKTTDGGETWSFASTPAPDNLESLFFLDEDIGYMVGKDGAIIHTSNGGSTWTLQASGTTKRLQGVFFTDVNNGMIAGRDNTLLQTSNGGAIWTSVSGTSGDLGNIYFNTPENGFICGEGGLYQVNADLSSIQFMNLDLLGEFNDIYFMDENVGWTCGDPGLVYVTNTAGASWIEVPLEGMPFELSGIHGRSLNSVFTVGDFGKVNGICPAATLIEEQEFNDFATLSITSNGVRILFSEDYLGEDRSIRLFDTKGMVVHDLRLNGYSKEITLDLSKSSGIYFINLVIGTRSVSTKFFQP